MTRIAIFVVPFVAAMSVAFLLSTQIPIASSSTVQVVRWVGIVAVSTLVMKGVDRVARRLLPLTVLLKLTLLFPDRAPSRFRVAIRTGTTAQLRKRLEVARNAPSGETRQEAAERLLELVGLLSHHDRLTRGHSERVRAYSHLIGEELGLTETELDKLRWAALLHDVGKTAIDTEILNKPGRLTPEEFETIKTHPDEGRALVEPLADWLGESIQAVWQHHERFDGRGYPLGLAGTEISFAARVVTVADAYDVMTSARSYKQPMSAEAARTELANCSGTHFDPVVVRAFLSVSLGRLRLMTGPLAWIAQLAFLEPAGIVHASASSAQPGVAGSAGSGMAVTGASSLSTSVASTATTAAATTGSAGVASTVAATAASVVAGAVGIAASSPVGFPTVAAAETGVVTPTAGRQDDLPSPEHTVLVLDTGAFETLDPAADRPSIEEAAAPAGAGEPANESVPASVPATTGPASSLPGSSLPGSSLPAPTGSTSAVPESPGADSPTPGVATTDPDERDSPTAPATAPTTAATTPDAQPAVTTTTTTSAPHTTTTEVATPTTTSPTATPSTATPSTSPTSPVTPSPPTARTVASTLYLGVGTVDGPAPAFHGIFGTAPLDATLANVDTDRDAAPGAIVLADGAGIGGTDPTKMLEFKRVMNNPFVIDDHLKVELYVAAKDFARKDVTVEVGVYRCNLLDQCTLLESDVREAKNAKKWKKTKFHFRDIDTTIGIGESIEVRVAVLGSSDADGWFAFGTEQFDSKIEFGGD